MGIKSHYLEDSNGNKFYPYAHANATFDENGVKVGTRLNNIDKNISDINKNINEHIENNEIHITIDERNDWDSAKTHADSKHARIDATKVESSQVNGNIKIDDNEIKVYEHPNSDVKPNIYKSVTVDSKGHIVEGTNPTTLSGFGITDAATTQALETEISRATESENNIQTNLSKEISRAESAEILINENLQTHINKEEIHFTKEEREKLSGISSGANAYTLTAAGTELGGVKSGGDVTINDGVITVKDDSHNHVISNVDGLQTALDSKLDKTVTDLGNMSDKTIADVQTALDNWIEINHTIPSKRAKFSCNISNFVTLWNANNTTDKIGAGAIITVEIDSYCSNDDYVLIKFTQHYAKKVYYVNKEDGVWKPIYKVAFSDGVQSELDKKVDKVDGKGLSTNDYTTTEKNKLANIASGAQVNQNAFSTVVAGSTTIESDSPTDTLTIASGTGITVTGDATNDKVTISNSGVRSIATGTSNGTIIVNTNGTTASVSVKGLGSAAYTNSTAYDAKGAADTALANAKTYTDGKIDAIIGEGASTTLDTIGEISKAIEEHQDVTDALNSAIGNKVDKVSGKGLSTNDYTTTEKNKLSGIASGAEVNQNAFSNIAVGSTTIAADTKTDTLTLVAGDNITITPDATNDKITIAATDTKYTHPSYTARTGVPTANATPTFGGTFSVSQPVSDATGHITAVNSRTITIPNAVATTSASGLMSSTDKSKLDGIASGANKYTHPSYTAKTSGLYKITVDNTGHVSAVTAVAKSDITALGIPSSDTNTHYTSKNVVNNSTSATTNTSTALTNGNVYLVSVENGVATSAHKISGSGATTVTTDASGNIVISSTDTNTTYTLSSFGITATKDEINKLDGLTATTTELNYVDGVTSNIQTQLDEKLSKSGDALTGNLEVLRTYELGSCYNYENGCLIEIGTSAQQTMIAIEITGNSYAELKPIKSIYQFYDYAINEGITNYGGRNFGLNLGTMTVYRYNSKLYAYIKQTNKFQTLSFRIFSNKSGLTPKVTNTAAHTSGYTNLITITPDNLSVSTHTHSSYVNQNAFSNVKVGSTTVAADTTTDTLELVAGSNVTITPDATNDKITIASSHPTISKSTDSTSTASPTHGGTFTTVDSITRDGNGHVTKVNTKTITLPSDTNTDTKVTQSRSSASNYRALLMHHVNESLGVDPGSTTEHVYYNESIVACPSTGELVATKFTGELNGKAAKATTLEGLTATVSELNYVDGVTSNIQTQLNSKAKGASISANTPATAGWYRIATSNANIANCNAIFQITGAAVGCHTVVTISAGTSYGVANSSNINVLQCGQFSTSSITKARIVYHTTYSGNYAYLEVYNPNALATTITVSMTVGTGWTLVTPSTAGSIPSGYSNKEVTLSNNTMVAGTFSGLATKATSATSATYATTASKAGTATYATNSGTSAYSSNSAKATSATSATYASTANYSKNSGTATYATNSGTASYASNSAKATSDSEGNNINTTYLKNATVSGKVITFTKGNGSTFSITTQDNNTDTKVTQTATTASANYPLLLAPSGTTATATTTTYFDSGVTLNPNTNTIEANISGLAAKATSATSATYSSTATYSSNSAKATSATSATYSSTATYATSAGSASKASSATSATYASTATKAGTANSASTATVDSAGNNINTTYLKNATVSGKVITFTKGNGSTFSITTQDNNTDTKVTQTAVADESTYTNWRPLVAGASGNATEGFTPTTVTDQLYAFDSLSVQPSSGTVRANVYKFGSNASIKYSDSTESLDFVFA